MKLQLWKKYGSVRSTSREFVISGLSGNAAMKVLLRAAGHRIAVSKCLWLYFHQLSLRDGFQISCLCNIPKQTHQLCNEESEGKTFALGEPKLVDLVAHCQLPIH
jgi:hypothetical protein